MGTVPDMYHLSSRSTESSDEAMDEVLEYEFVCTLDDVPESSRKCMLLPSSKRSVLLLNIDGEIHCMDQACYRKARAGGR